MPTPQQIAAQNERPQGALQTEPGTGKQFMITGDGRKYYPPPPTLPGGHGPSDTGGGGLFHGRQMWNSDTGEYESHLDVGKIMSWVAAGVITAGAADAFLSGAGAAPVVTGGTSGTLPSSGSLSVGALPAGGAPTGMAGGAAIPGASTFGGGSMGLGAKFFGKAADYGEELAGIAKGRQAGREAEGRANESFDRTRVLADQNRLNAAKYNQGLPGQRVHDSVQGDILAGVQPVTGSGSGKDFHLSGGLSPALISGQSRALGQVVGAAASGNTGAGADMDPGRAALLEQLAGSYAPFKPEFTAATPMPQANALDDILTGAGYAGKLYDVYRGGK